MRCEMPVLLRCCFCFPLRHGLLVWAYIKQIFSLFFLAFMIRKFYHGYLYTTQVAVNEITLLIIIFVVLDIVLHVLFIISAHTKDYRKMRIFYRYSIVVLCLIVVVTALFIALWAYYEYMSPMHFTLIMSLLSLCFQGYLIILVRSELIKLKNNSQFEFMNHVTDENCTANLDFVKEIPVTL